MLQVVKAAIMAQKNTERQDIWRESRDGGCNGEEITEYKVLDSIIRSPIFNGGTTSRINVGDFMSDLIINTTKWNEWKGKMPVIYNISSIDAN